MIRGVVGLALGAAVCLLVGCRSPVLPRETVEDAVPAPAEPAPAPEPQRALLLRGGSIMTAAGPTLPNADVLVVGSKIRAVGSGLDAPGGAAVVELAGRWVTPGLIDAHSHLGVYPVPAAKAHRDGNETSDPFTPQVRAEDSFWPQDPAIRAAVAGGVTTILVLPGSANLVGGRGATLRLRRAPSASAMEFPGAPETMKMACGENPKRVYGSERKRAPVTRMGEVAMLRGKLEEARAYAAAEPPPPDKKKDFGLEALSRVVTGETLVENHCYRADEMLLRLEVFGEFGIKPRAFHHAVEAYKIREQLAEAGVGVAVWADWWGTKLELFDAVPAGAALLDAAGVRVAIHSDSPDDIQRLNQEAAKAMTSGRRAGVEVARDRAIRWVTANPAWLLGIEDRVGTIEPGKDADLVVWSGDPFSVYTHADLVFIEGDRVYDRAEPGLYPISDFELGIEQ